MKRKLLTDHIVYPKENLWKRGRPEHFAGRDGYIEINRNLVDEYFDELQYVNMDLDVDTKRASLNVSPSVVGLACVNGEEAIFMTSGTIIDNNKNLDGSYSNTILTSASLLTSLTVDRKIEVSHQANERECVGSVVAYDLHYNLAIISIQSDTPLPVATLMPLDDSISIDPCKNSPSDMFPVRPHMGMFNLCPGVMVVAVGRHFEDTSLMVAPGKFSLDRCQFDCKELFRASCKISKPGIGGPLINYYGEVIGVNFFDELYTPFLPINIVSKWLDHFKKHGRFSRPCLGMEVTNLYAAHVSKLDNVNKNFPDIFKGVIVEKVIPDSPSDRAGILRDDVIIQCGGNVVTGFLEFFEKIWDKVGESVEMIVIRKGKRDFLKLTMAIDETTPDKLNSWPLPKEYRLRVQKVRSSSDYGGDYGSDCSD